MRKNVFLFATAGAVMAAACSDGGTGPEEPGPEVLSAAEVAMLNTHILQSGIQLRRNFPGSYAGPVTYQGTESCSPVGQTRREGYATLTWDDATSTSSMTAEFDLVHEGCARRMGSGAVVTLQGDSGIHVALVGTMRSGALHSLLIQETGAVTWARDDGNSGRCMLDVTARMQPPSQQITVSGSFCGLPLTGTVPVL